MTIDHSAHHVAKIIIGEEFKFESGGSEMASREIEIVFEDGSTQSIECFSVATNHITLEVR